MRRICAWCGSELPNSNPEGGSVSHGICFYCAEGLLTQKEFLEFKFAQNADREDAGPPIPSWVVTNQLYKTWLFQTGQLDKLKQIKKENKQKLKEANNLTCGHEGPLS